MSEEDLELLITLDDPEGTPEGGAACRSSLGPSPRRRRGDLFCLDSRLILGQHR